MIRETRVFTDVTRTLLYAEECPILMRTEMGHKTGLSPILMRTESMNFGRRSDTFWVHKWPVGSDVRSHMRTFWGGFVDFDLSLRTWKNFVPKILPPALDLCSSSPLVSASTLGSFSFKAPVSSEKR